MDGQFRDFAKVYTTSRGPVLVVVEENSDGKPAIGISCVVAGGECIKINIGGWEDTEFGWEKAYHALGMTDLEVCENFATKIVSCLEAESTPPVDMGEK